MPYYGVKKILEPGLVLLSRDGDLGGLWCRIRLKSSRVCARCGWRLGKGSAAFSPVSSTRTYRSEKLCEPCATKPRKRPPNKEAVVAPPGEEEPR